MKKLLFIIMLATLLTGCAGDKVAESQFNAKMDPINTGAAVGAGAGLVAAGVTDLSTIPTAPFGAVVGALAGQQIDEHRYPFIKQGVTMVHWGDEVFFYIPADKLFPVDDDNLDPRGYSILNQIGSIIRGYTNKHAYVSAYTDDLGSKADREQHSTLRAQAVAGYLWAHGISRNQLKIQGFGQKNAVASNRMPNGNAMNRRIAIVLK